MRWHHKPQPADVRLHVCYHFPPLDCLLQAVTSSGQRVDIIVGVDTVVESAGVILEKPEDAEHALRMLQSLSGGRHYVHTGVVLKFMDGSSHSFHETTQIQFAAVCMEASVYLNARSQQQHHLFVQALQAYVATGEVCQRVRLSDVEFACFVDISCSKNQQCVLICCLLLSSADGQSWRFWHSRFLLLRNYSRCA